MSECSEGVNLSQDDVVVLYDYSGCKFSQSYVDVEYDFIRWVNILRV